MQSINKQLWPEFNNDKQSIHTSSEKIAQISLKWNGVVRPGANQSTAVIKNTTERMLTMPLIINSFSQLQLQLQSQSLVSFHVKHPEAKQKRTG